MFIQKTSGSRVRNLQVQVRESGGRGAGGALPVHAAGGQPGGGAVLQAAVIHTVSVKPEIATKHGAVEEKFE